MKKKKMPQKPLTLEALANYNQNVFFPALDAHFATKTELKEFKTEFKEFKNEMSDFKNEMNEFKNEMHAFKDKTLSNDDKMFEKLDILLTEKQVREYREEKENKLWAIVIKSLKEHKILTSKELEEIAGLEIF